ncbi:Hpt domain-containing protein [Hankyongella ginsenosidimutans]|uniref:Hpt domain-containing protein n=1 Tax=Hankyongella ginsenosidimutans TaxID=1763828 RepID=A0A4D7C3D6_9SPHN|nr:Hpt domain-containing protein [Hankyongella ginsenosidimutans]QCI79591.1 Hpt domain-containing protein [Hankyongella ginsenosidimutans]
MGVYRQGADRCRAGAHDLSARHEAFELAHSLAGVAGNFGEPALGRWAAALCRYLRRCGEAAPDPAILAQFAHVYAHLQDDPWRGGPDGAGGLFQDGRLGCAAG